jgi:acetyl-CoA carboxylase biotin carboxyl carrier protein
MKDLDFTKIFDSMKTNDISEFVIKEGRTVYEIRRGGFKQNIIAGSSTQTQAVPQVISQLQSAQQASATSAFYQQTGSSQIETAPVSNFYEIKSPLVGTYYGSPNPDSPLFVDIGSRVTKGQILCIVEAMKNFNEIESDVDGVVKEICLKNGDLVEFGKVLFKIEKQ